jgi:hypothetical protein
VTRLSITRQRKWTSHDISLHQTRVIDGLPLDNVWRTLILDNLNAVEVQSNQLPRSGVTGSDHVRSSGSLLGVRGTGRIGPSTQLRPHSSAATDPQHQARYSAFLAHDGQPVRRSRSVLRLPNHREVPGAARLSPSRLSGQQLRSVELCSCSGTQLSPSPSPPESAHT